MSSKRRLSTTPSPSSDDTDSTATSQPSSVPKSNLCLICGDHARIINYGALSCQSCKTFFRRNGYRPETVRPCIYNQNCEVNMQTRHSCTACRLAKCLAVGMSSDLIRKEDRKKAKMSPSTRPDDSQPNLTQQITTTSLPLTLDLNEDTRAALSSSELTLLSNILYAYEVFSIVSRVSHTIENLSIASSESHIDVLNPLEVISQIFTSIQSFISALPDFRILTIDEQTSLFERNLHGIIGFYFLLFSRNTKILDHTQCLEAFIDFYGLETITLTKTAIDRLDPDSTIIKLMLVILAFSSHCLIITDKTDSTLDGLLYGAFRLFGSQNVYLDLLWKYMIYQYGYTNSTIRFSRLMQTISCVLKTSANVYLAHPRHQDMVDRSLEKFKISLARREYEQTFLWGKTSIN